MSGTGKSPHDPADGLSASSLSSVRRQMVEFDDLPRQVREALSSADAPSDQMIDVLCTMHRSGFPLADLMKVIAASNAKSGGS
ncbi:hypothetical protein BH10PSE10_BH10PSE10_11510 [soil metagenome]